MACTTKCIQSRSVHVATTRANLNAERVRKIQQQRNFNAIGEATAPLFENRNNGVLRAIKALTAKTSNFDIVEHNMNAVYLCYYLYRYIYLFTYCALTDSQWGR